MQFCYLDFKEIASPLTITRGQYRCVNLDEILPLEEVVDGHCGRVPDPQQTGEGVGPCSQVRELTDIV